MLTSKDEELESLESELEALFEETAYRPQQRILYRAARVAAQLPSEPHVKRAQWWWRLRVPVLAGLGAMCMFFGIHHWEGVPERMLPESTQSWQGVDRFQQAQVGFENQSLDDLNLLSAGDLGFEGLDLPAADIDLVAWQEAYEDVLEEI